ncbi:WHG domain-containing protein [Actinomadura sp. 3N407]|uniref:WHG domain-containing protein n=1 Tax=Actinomadura sp. 3N407 TaxID=3457423 RepID=UPI003FCCCA37
MAAAARAFRAFVLEHPGRYAATIGARRPRRPEDVAPCRCQMRSPGREGTSMMATAPRRAQAAKR